MVKNWNCFGKSGAKCLERRTGCQFLGVRQRSVVWGSVCEIASRGLWVCRICLLFAVWEGWWSNTWYCILHNAYCIACCTLHNVKCRICLLFACSGRMVVQDGFLWWIFLFVVANFPAYFIILSSSPLYNKRRIFAQTKYFNGRRQL